MKCERTTTAVTLKRQVIDKVNIRRGTTAGFELDEKDFQLVKLPLGSTLAKYSTDEDKWPDSASSIPDEAKVIETCTTEQERANASGSIVKCNAALAILKKIGTAAVSRSTVDVSGLKSIHGLYLMSTDIADTSAPNAWVVATAPVVGPNTMWSLHIENKEVGYIQDQKKRYLCANDKGKVYTSSKGPLAQWYFEDSSYFKGIHGGYLTVHPDGRVTTDGQGAWGKFDVCGKVVEGFLKKKSSKGKWQKRFFRLAEHRLCYWESKPTIADLPPKKSWDLGEGSNPKISEGPGHLVMTIKFFDIELALQAGTVGEFQTWMSALQQENKKILPMMQVLQWGVKSKGTPNRKNLKKTGSDEEKEFSEDESFREANAELDVEQLRLQNDHLEELLGDVQLELESVREELALAHEQELIRKMTREVENDQASAEGLDKLVASNAEYKRRAENSEREVVTLRSRLAAGGGEGGSGEALQEERAQFAAEKAAWAVHKAEAEEELRVAKADVEAKRLDIEAKTELLRERDLELERECELLNRKIIEYNNRAKELNRRNEDLKKKKKLFKQRKEEELKRTKPEEAE